MAKMLTERQAWLRVAELWSKAEPIANPAGFGLDLGYGLNEGLCTTIHDLEYDGLIDESVRVSMEEKLEAMPKNHHRPFVWERTEDGAKERIAFCRKMASLLATKKRKPARGRR